ncbi:MAG: hypothetical protein LUD77_07175 [Clostridiales bacterium]|nr:hypothetical protein [Clostridiales bacterium]
MKSNTKQNLLLAASALALIGAIATSTGCGKTVQAEKTTRTAEGMITDYSENGAEMNIITFDGEKWTLKGFISVPYTKCIVTFNTNGTAEVEDDIIIAVDTHMEF